MQTDREQDIRALAERKVDGLSYSSFLDLSQFFEERFHLTLVDDKDAQFVTEAIEVRNISVHNRCIVNRRYRQKTQCDEALIRYSRHPITIKLLPDELAMFLAKIKAPEGAKQVEGRN
jgi:hypothetical protein